MSKQKALLAALSVILLFAATGAFLFQQSPNGTQQDSAGARASPKTQSAAEYSGIQPGDPIPIPTGRAARGSVEAVAQSPHQTVYSGEVETPDSATYSLWKELSADGDDSAALRVFKVLNDCSSVDRNHAKAERALAKGEIDRAEGFLDRADRLSGACKEIDSGDISNAVAWLKRSADLGNDEARLLYRAFGGPSEEEAFRNPDSVKDYKDRAVRYLLEASANGNVEAMSFLATEFYQGNLVDRNVLAALSYAYAVERSGVGSPYAPQLIETWSQEVSPEVLEQASSLGWEILDRCCG